MPGGEAVKARFEQLIAQADEVSRADAFQQKAWLVAANHAVQLVCPSASGPYHTNAHRIMDGAVLPLRFPVVPEMVTLLTRLREEIELGLLTSVENRAIAVTFDGSSITAPNT